jgi:hypothetical protein
MTPSGRRYRQPILRKDFSMRWFHLLTTATTYGLLAASGLLMADEPQDRHVFQIGGGCSFSGTYSRGKSYGHAYLVSGEPGCSFGGVQDREGNWALNYLILIKHSATSTSEFHLGNPDPAKSSNSSDGKIRFLDFNEKLRFDQSSVAWTYKAQFDAAKDTLISEEMAFQEKPMDLAKGRAFVVDMTVEPVTIQQIKVKLPSSDEIDFINSTAEQYKAFTRRWFAEIAKGSEVASETFGQ